MYLFPYLYRCCVSDHDRLLVGTDDGLYVLELLRDGEQHYQRTDSEKVNCGDTV